MIIPITLVLNSIFALFFIFGMFASATNLGKPTKVLTVDTIFRVASVALLLFILDCFSLFFWIYQ